MTPHTIIWDFDGTLYPLRPYDSEQSLLRLRLEQGEIPGWHPKRNLIRWLIYADRHQWFSGASRRKMYSRLYGWCLKGVPVSLLDRTAEIIAARITFDDRNALRQLYNNGFSMLVISCGTLDLCERVLKIAGIDDCFESVWANPLYTQKGTVSGQASLLITAEDKLKLARKLVSHAPKGIAAVGDGYTDIPLLDWVEMPIMLDPHNKKKSTYPSKSYLFTPSIASIQNHLL